MDTNRYQVKSLTFPSSWPIIKFGDVVSNVNENEPNPLDNGLERHVGLEHLDPESLHIKRWGLIADGTSFTRKFTAGQVLFGKRRAYQRKAAVAEFDGLCSGDILVFEPKDDRLLPELLPFIVQSDGFVDHALGTSAGSLSPRTRWRDLAAYEFPLPPIDEQRRIAEILWAADEAIELHFDARAQSKKFSETLNATLMQAGLNQGDVHKVNSVICPRYWQVKQLQDIAEVERGRFAHRPRNLPVFYGGRYPFAQTGDIANSDGVLNSYEQTLSESGKAISRSFKAGSILITIAAIIGKTAVTQFEVWCPDSIVGITPNKDINVYFLEFYLRTVQKQLEQKVATQTAQKNINLGVLRPLLVPVPPREEQDRIAEILLSLQRQVENQNSHITKLQEVRRALLSELLNPKNLNVSRDQSCRLSFHQH